MVSQRCVCDGLERLRAAGAEVEDTGNAVFPEPQVHRRDVADVDEVALEAIAAFKQFRTFAIIQLSIQMESDAGHAAFMAFARPVDVEIAEADDLRVRFRQDLTDVFIKQKLGVAVNVERLLVFAGFNKVAGAAAVGRRGRGVQERNFTLQAVVKHLFRVLIVVIHHVLAVPLRGGRAGAFMENSVDIAELFARHNLDQKVFFIHVVGNVQIHQIDEFGAVFQIIYDQNVGNALVIQRFNDIAADKACAAGNDDHNCNL